MPDKFIKFYLIKSLFIGSTLFCKMILPQRNTDYLILYLPTIKHWLTF